MQPVNVRIYEEFEAYPFDSDDVFKQGISDILSTMQSSGDPQISKKILNQAKAFYFSSTTGKTIVWEDYEAYVLAKKVDDSEASYQPLELSASPHIEQRELSLAEISALIESGQTNLIPNNVTVAQGVNASPPSGSSECQRAKPWEDYADFDSAA